MIYRHTLILRPFALFRFSLLITLCLLASVCLTHAQTRSTKSAGSIIVKLKKGASPSVALQNAVAARTGARLTTENRLVRSGSGKGMNTLETSASGLDRIFVLPVSESERSGAISSLKKFDEIEYVQPNYIYKIDEAPASDPSIDRQWYLRNVRADKAWEIGRGDSSINVGVLDTGLDWLHPDLRAQIRINRSEDLNKSGFFEAWPSSEQREDVNGNLLRGDIDGIDQDNNGYPDDVIGYDFVDQETLNFGDASGRDPIPTDEHSHGTLVAGVIAAAQNNGEGISGIAPGCRVVALRAFDATGNAEDDDVASAIIYAADNGVSILNLSFGDFVPSMLQRDAIRYALARGVTVFASSGNEGGFDRHYPSDFDEVISVGATANQPFEDILASLTTYGEGMDLVAPGSEIFTTDLDGEYKAVSGTSFSTPIAAAVGALLLSRNPGLTPEEVRGVLTSTARDLGEKGYDPEYANGRVDAFSALQYRGGATIRFASPRTNDAFKVGQSVSIRGTAVSTLFTGYTISYAKALDPKVIVKRDNARNWTVIRSSSDQIINGELGTWNTTGLEPGLYTLRLAVASSDQRSTEERINVQVIGEPLRLVSTSVDTIFINERRGLLIRATASRIARFQVDYRVTGATTWSSKTDDRLTLGHGLLISNREAPIGSQLDLRIILTDAAGEIADTQVIAGMVTDAITQTGFNTKSYALPPGYALDTVLSTPAGDQVVMSLYPDGVNFGPLSVFEFKQNKFSKVDSLKETWIPRAIGNTRGGTIPELLLQADRNSALYAGDGSRGLLGKQLFRSTPSQDLWGSELIDIDGDGREEIIGKSSRRDGSRFQDVYVALTFRNGGYSQLAETKNTTTPPPGQAANRYTEPSTAAADLNGNGKLEVITIDSDADIIAYEYNDANSTLEPTFTQENDGFADGSLLTSGDFNGDGRPDIAFAYHTDFDLNTDREYDPAFWTVKVLLNGGSGKFSEAFNENFYFARPLTPYRSSVRAIRDVTGDGKDDLVVSLFPNFYLIGLDQQGNMSPQWHHPVSVSARGAVAFDFDRNNIREFGFVAGDSIRFFERDAEYVGRTKTPGGLVVTPIDEERVELEWGSVAGAEKYLVLRVQQGGQQFDVIDEVAENRYVDIDVSQGVTFFYSIIAVDSSQATPQSLLAQSVRAFVHAKPRIASVTPVGQHLRIVTTSSVAPAFTSGGVFVIDDSIASTTKVGGDSLLVVTPLKKLSPGLHRIRVASRELRDKFNSPFDSSITLTWMQPDADIDTQRFYIVRWRFENDKRIRIVFNSMPSDDALEVDRYTLDPYGKLTRVYRDTIDRNALYIDLAEGTKIVALGKPFVLCVTEIHDEFGIAIEETKGNCVGVTLTEPDLENVMVYPNPAKRSNRELMFARLTAEAEISIFTLDMRFLRQIKTTERNGGVLWDMLDENGEQLPSGIYLYQARGKDDNGKAVDDKAAKFVIIADE